MRSYEETAQRLFDRREVYLDRKRQKRKKQRRVAVVLSVTLCFCAVTGVILHTLTRLDYFAAACGSSPGVITEEGYFYYVQHEGVCRYDPQTGKQEQRLSKYWFDAWTVNDYGIYYWRNRTLWVLPHGTEDRQKLYTAPLSQSTHISCELMSDGHLAVTVYDKHAELKSQLKLDGVSGEVLETLSVPVSYDSRELLYTETCFMLGDRVLTLEPADDYNSVFVLMENGVPLLPEAQYAGQYPERWGDALIFGVRDKKAYSDPDASGDTRVWYQYILRPDGADNAICREIYVSYFGGGGEDYLFYVNRETIYCVDAHTDEHWPLRLPEDLPSRVDIYDIRTDGHDLYTSAPWSETQAHFEVVYEGGVPMGLKLIDGDIGK